MHSRILFLYSKAETVIKQKSKTKTRTKQIIDCSFSYIFTQAFDYYTITSSIF